MKRVAPITSPSRTFNEMEVLNKQYATYKISETDGCFSVVYTLIKNGKAWGTLHYINKGNDADARVQHKSGSATTWTGFSSHSKALEAVEANETRLSRKQSKLFFDKREQNPNSGLLTAI